ncbi:MAG: pyridoxamine 5'-phosphate oxidase family protein [Actinophytocola sp.]|nr:pyridoxamine 5'-phosphate oxidase family protein [Actinophytocola sp.]
MCSTWRDPLRSAAASEVIWGDSDNRPHATVATPLLFGDRPALAFPYARAQLARAIGAATSVAVVLSDRRLSGTSWRPLAIVGRPRLIDDPDGTVFTDQLLDQELRKHPPSRALVDSILLRKEHWWYLPRIIVELEPDTSYEVTERAGSGTDGVLGVVDTDLGRVRVASVVVTPGGGPSAVTAVEGELPGAGGDERPAVLVRHDFSVPDLERWPVSVTPGAVRSHEFVADAPVEQLVLPPPLGLLARLRKQRQLSKGCRRELARAGSAHG